MRWLGFGMLIALASCGPQQQPPPPSNNATSPVVPAPSAPPAVENNAPPAESAHPAVENKAPPATSLPEAKGPIDPKSVEAAGQVVQHYGALIEQHRFNEAAKYWGDAGAAAKFAQQLKRDVHLEIGNLGETEGAAGSNYTTVPVVFYGSGYRRPASAILRRVNDVPGSTAAQRRWHIERIEWGNAG
jgi:hypothetical protein